MPKKLPTVAEVLRDAADNHLREPQSSHQTPGDFPESKSVCSCQAVSYALAKIGIKEQYRDDRHSLWMEHSFAEKINKFLKELGCDTNSWTAFGFDFSDLTFAERQEIRYAWLNFAADYAEELGI